VHQNELGFALSATKVPLATSCSVRRCHSSGVPSHQTILSGVVSSAVAATHEVSAVAVTGASSMPGTVKVVMVMRSSCRTV
jgi:hypothetical protein